MRILLLAAANSVHTMQWANAFVRRGAEVHLLTQHAPIPGFDERVIIHDLPHRKGLGYLLNGPEVAGSAGRLRPDLLNVHYATGYGSLARWVRNVPVVLNVWGSDVHDFPDRGPLHRWWLLHNLKHATRIVSTSKAMAARTRALLGGDAPITVVPFGVDLEVFKPGMSRQEGPVVIGTVKTLKPVYGVDLLVEAFIRLQALPGLPPLWLRIVGEGPEKARLQARLASAGVLDRAIFTGAVPHHRVPDELGKLDIYVALSRAESFGVAVIEASACGLPVVVSDAGGLPEVVQEGVTGRIVPSGDVEGAVDAMTKLIVDPGLRARMGQAGRIFVAGNYALDHCVDRQMKVFEEVLQQFGK